METARKEGRDDALAEVRSLMGGGAIGSGGKKPSAKRARRTAKKHAKRAKSKKPRKNPWAGLTPAEKLKRVNAIRVGRGLPPKKKL